MIHVWPELTPFSLYKPVRRDKRGALQRPCKLFWVCLRRQVLWQLHQYNYNSPWYLPLLTNDWTGGNYSYLACIQGCVCACCCNSGCNTLGFWTSVLTYICYFLCNHSFVRVCSASECIPRHVQACVRDSLANVCCSVQFVCVCAGPQHASVCSLHDSSKQWVELRHRTSFIEKSVVFLSPSITSV